MTSKNSSIKLSLLDVLVLLVESFEYILALWLVRYAVVSCYDGCFAGLSTTEASIGRGFEEE